MSPALAPLQGALPIASATGGLRCAPTTGYFLATLRVALRGSLRSFIRQSLVTDHETPIDFGEAVIERNAFTSFMTSSAEV